MCILKEKTDLNLLLEEYTRSYYMNLALPDTTDELE